MEDPCQWPKKEQTGWPDENMDRNMEGLSGEVVNSQITVSGSSGRSGTVTSGMKGALLHMVRLGLRERILHPSELRRLVNGDDIMKQEEGTRAGNVAGPTELKASPGRYLGKIKSYSSAKGYGFMLCTSDGEYSNKDIYIHKNVFDEIWPVPSPNRPDDIYEFDIHKNKDGKPQASRPVRVGPPQGDAYGGYGASLGGYGSPPSGYPPYGPPRNRRGGRPGRW